MEIIDILVSGLLSMALAVLLSIVGVYSSLWIIGRIKKLKRVEKGASVPPGMLEMVEVPLGFIFPLRYVIVTDDSGQLHRIGRVRLWWRSRELNALAASRATGESQCDGGSDSLRLRAVILRLSVICATFNALFLIGTSYFTVVSADFLSAVWSFADTVFSGLILSWLAVALIANCSVAVEYLKASRLRRVRVADSQCLVDLPNGETMSLPLVNAHIKEMRILSKRLLRPIALVLGSLALPKICVEGSAETLCITPSVPGYLNLLSAVNAREKTPDAVK